MRALTTNTEGRMCVCVCVCVCVYVYVYVYVCVCVDNQVWVFCQVLSVSDNIFVTDRV